MDDPFAKTSGCACVRRAATSLRTLPHLKSVSRMKRVVTSELLDFDSGTPSEVAASLRDLDRINQWFGGVSTTEAMLRRVVQRTGKAEFSLLDVASGSGALPIMLRQRLARKKIVLNPTVLDRARTHLNGTRNAVVADALTLPFANARFDIVSCALFVHHLEVPEIVRFANEALRVARLAVLINDIRRSRLTLLATYASWAVIESRLSRYDGPVSVRRAYTAVELRDALQRTHAAELEIRKHPLFRIGAILWK
jgi:ubiquinone/menaquinone biosynthesis C-methylase UbiE